VTTETTTSQDRLDILIEIKASRILRAVATDGHPDCEGHNDHTKAEAYYLPGFADQSSGLTTAGWKMYAV
jgi:hypothetical protein